MAYLPDTVKTGLIQAVQPGTRTELVRHISSSNTSQVTVEDIKSLLDPAAPDPAASSLQAYDRRPFGVFTVDPLLNGAGTLP